MACKILVHDGNKYRDGAVFRARQSALTVEKPKNFEKEKPCTSHLHTSGSRSCPLGEQAFRTGCCVCALGIECNRLYGADGGNKVAVSVDVHDIEGMKAAFNSPELAAGKQAHGVVEPVLIHIEME